jgi:hypothetical protein
MRKLWIDLKESPAEIRAGLAEIVAEYPRRFTRVKRLGVALTFEQDPALKRGGLAVAKRASACRVRYGRKVDAFRALGRLMGEASVPRSATERRGGFSETPRFDLLGIMIDVSRNGVLTPEAARAMLRRCALMGLNMAILYTEDTYEVPGEPFFGYLRGRYTHDEMKSLDDYADALGIEMFPCIQTLGHLQQVLQWPAYAAYRDTDDILLAGEEKTCALLDKMIAAASAPFRSRRIHIGMDEAHGIGSGRFKQLHGQKRPFDILNDHLARVRDLCRKRGLRPMIWSDMYFALGSKTGGYYDLDSVVPPDVAAKIPRDMQLVYWDYYHYETDFYREMIRRHRALGSDPVVAGGIWTWNHLWAALPHSFTAVNACMRACKEEKLREVFMTMWGDDGMECDVFSALPGLQLFAEHGYADAVDPALLRANFRGSCDAVLDDWFKASEVDSVPCLADPSKTPTNVSKWLLWQDPLLALMDPEVAGGSLRGHYEKLSAALFRAAKKTRASRRLIFPARLARALALKCELRRDLAEAYAAGNRRKLRKILEGDLVALRKAVDELWKCHRDLWLVTYKPFGLEVIEKRYGGLRARLESLSDRLYAYLGGKVLEIPELEARLEKIGPGTPGDLPTSNYSRVSTPSCIK